MNYRIATLFAEKSFSADATEVIDIDIKDPLSQIIINNAVTNGAAADAIAHPANIITKVELVDGSEVLYSLSGVEAQAADWYHNKHAPYNWFRYQNGQESAMVFNMNFGRKLYDTELAFDPSKFRNPQLKITLDVDAGGQTPGASSLKVFAHAFDQKSISPIGFLMHKEIKSFILANNSHEYTDLPTDYPYRKLFVRAQRDSSGFDQQLANLKLSEDVDKRILFNLTGEDLVEILQNTLPPYIEHIVGNGTTALRVFYCTPGLNVIFTGAGQTTAASTGQTFDDGDGGYFREIQSSAGPNFGVHVMGYCPHSAIEIPFGDQNDIDDWYDVTQIGNLKLDLTGGSSVGSSQTSQIFLQQLRRY